MNRRGSAYTGPLFVSTFTGRRAAGEGEPRLILALHGIEAHGLRFVGLATYLPEATIVAPDLRGHGRSPKQGPWTIEQHVDDLLPLLNSLGSDVILLGHSYGGLLAWELARAAPERLSALVLVDPAIALAPDFARHGRRLAAVRHEWTDAQSALRDMLAGRAPEAHWSVALDLAVATKQDADGLIKPLAAQEAVDACWADHVLEPLGETGYRGPTLLLEAGRERGSYCSPNAVTEMRRQLGDLLHHVVLDMPHTIPADGPELLAEQLRVFLSTR